ncbi:hypothetical protein, partial [Pseudomonas aeruginosa]|uniref:hypothetical protein n=1 Tax=Pseudomonas aeruginosa TaxID=287 RepID=UPI0021175CD4
HGRVPVEGGSAIFAAAAFMRYRAEVMGDGLSVGADQGPPQHGEQRPGIRAKSVLKGVNSGSLKHFQWQPSLRRKRFRWTHWKPIKKLS